MSNSNHIDNNEIGYYLLAAAIVRSGVEDLTDAFKTIYRWLNSNKKIKSKELKKIGDYKCISITFQTDHPNPNKIQSYNFDTSSYIRFFNSDWCKFLSSDSGTDQLIRLAIHNFERERKTKYLIKNHIFSPNKIRRWKWNNNNKIPLMTKEEWIKDGWIIKKNEKAYEDYSFCLKNNVLDFKKEKFYHGKQVMKEGK